ncbi:hypothetical protein VN97_g11879 [Penicillium thymicola]|uniref:Uncharacterized protein n=1 Tax=Penicillium thymicola TaxID=293382 RepID=A0AAI9T6J5_PENTH|nr:hypothetical protein VN97_g11879 [Penicillium thymicola]
MLLFINVMSLQTVSLRFARVLICSPNINYPDQIPLFYLASETITFLGSYSIPASMAWFLGTLLAAPRRNVHGPRGPIAPGVDCIAPGNEKWYPGSVGYYFWEQSIACLGVWNLGVTDRGCLGCTTTPAGQKGTMFGQRPNTQATIRPCQLP